MIWNSATRRHRAPLWDRGPFEALTVPTESGQRFDTGGSGKENYGIKKEALFSYLVTAPIKKKEKLEDVSGGNKGYVRPER